MDENVVHVEEDALEVGDDVSLAEKQRKKLANMRAKTEVH